MPNTFNNTTFSTTYYDDWKDSDHYHQLLFNDARTLQARELTQLQTVINKDIQKFADNIFKEGAVVKPGGLTLNGEYEFVKLNTTTGATPTSSYVGSTVTGATSGIQAKIVEVVDATGSDPATLYVIYTDLNGGSQLRFTPGETLNITGLDDVVVQTTNTIGENLAVGQGLQISIGDGIYYVKGHFVFCEKQSVILNKYSPYGNNSVVLKVVEDVITTADDTGLFDNSGGTPNLSAPGADRYRIRLILDIASNMDSDTNFISIADVNKGEIYRIVDENNSYNIPNDVIARRIKENSGDYLVEPFSLKYELDSASSSTRLDAILGNGIAVISGYRIEQQFNNTFSITRAQNTQTETGEQVPTAFGNYVKVSTGQGADSGDIVGLPNINTFTEFNLYTGASKGGAQAGKARLRHVTENGVLGYKFHLFDIDLDPGVNFRNIKSLGDSNSGEHFNIVQENGVSVLYETNKNHLLFPTPYIRPNNFANISLTYQQYFSATTDGTGNLTITVTDVSNETFDNTADWLVVHSGSSPNTAWTISAGGTGSTTASLTGLANSTTYDILAYVKKASNVASRTKTLTTSTVSAVASTTDSDGNTVYSLGQPDIYKLDSVRIASSTGNDVIGRFELDNGQRDNFYDIGRLVLKGGQSAPTTIYAKFKHFEHGATGEFFSAKSYTGQVNYEDVYSYRRNDGTVINLNDVLDFRPVKNASGTFSGGDARVHYLPQPTDTVQADITYYLPRKDIIIANKDGEFFYVSGTSSLSPVYPIKPAESMLLYSIDMNPYTLSDSDMTIRREDHRRYTMKDIGKLDKRIDNLEEVTALSLLETNLSNLNVLDSAGNVRAKTGFFVDNFKTDTYADINNIGYRASLSGSKTQPYAVNNSWETNWGGSVTELVNDTLQPSFYLDNIRLVYDSDNSTGVIRKGSTVLMNYEELTYVNNDQGTGTININPFEVAIMTGMITLSPNSDDWYDKEVVQKDAGTETTTKVVSRRQSDTITKKVVNERTISETYIPYIRSQLVYFRVEGLRPNSRVYAFFDDRDVSQWVRQQSSFVSYGSTTTDYGNQYNTATQYPFEGGPTNLVTDANGSLIGSFFIPNTDAIRFETGVKEFKILDVAAAPGQSYRFGLDEALSRATAKYSAEGILKRIEQDVISYKTVYQYVAPPQIKSSSDRDDKFVLVYRNGKYQTVRATANNIRRGDDIRGVVYRSEYRARARAREINSNDDDI